MENQAGGLSGRERAIITLSALVSRGLVDSSFEQHLSFAKNNGVTRAEMEEILSQLAFYAGSPKVRAASRMMKKIYDEPETKLPVTVELLTEGDFCWLTELEDAFLQEIGESPLTAEGRERLRNALLSGKITFFQAKRGSRAVGMCSVARCFSTFFCSDTGVFDDFYIKPEFRMKGIARTLARAAQDWCSGNGIVSLTVCCAPCDEEMYQALGFETRLGSTWAWLG